MDIDVEVNVEIDSYFGCLKGVSKSVQVVFTVIEAVLLITDSDGFDIGKPVPLPPKHPKSGPLFQN